jgi:hypothetical protein
MLTDLASGLGVISPGVATSVGATWVRVQVGHTSYPLTPESVRHHEWLCAEAEIKDIRARVRR